MMLSGHLAKMGVFAERSEKFSDDSTDVYVVRDTDPNASEIKNWRHPGLIKAKYTGDISGLDTLWVSSSAAPSERDVYTIARNIRELTNQCVGKMIMLDLREESHAYLNGQAMTLATTHNWVNRGKTAQQSQQSEDDWIATLAAQSEVKNVLVPDQHKNFILTEGATVQVESVVSEKQIAQQAGFEYKRLMVSDHMASRPEVVDEFIVFVDQLPDNTWIHAHCRGGEGRSTSYLLMLDMLKNAGTVSFDDIIKRHASIPPHYDISQMTRRCKELTVYYRERYEFIRTFYAYAKERHFGYRGLWSDWLAKQSLQDDKSNVSGLRC